jgi:hypothetical protein
VSDPPALQVSEIGSFYVGGESVRVEGLPARGRVSTPGGPIAPASTGNIYELRNYRAKPGGAVYQWLDAFTAALPAREKYSKIVGLWQTEAGQPNEVCHIWAYPSLNARAELAAMPSKTRSGKNSSEGVVRFSTRCTRPSCCLRRTRP